MEKHIYCFLGFSALEWRNPRGQGSFPVILASVLMLLSIHIHKVMSLLFAVTESTAHDCRLRGLSINHTDCVALCVRVCVCACIHVSLVSLLRVTIGYEEH